MRWIRRLLWIGALVATLVAGWLFAARNEGLVRVDYLVGETLDVALWQVLVVAFALGALAVGTLMLVAATRHGLVQRRYRKLINGLETELHQLRNLPLAPEVDASDSRSTGMLSASGRGRDA
jgi:uncharacterized membrane protein YciS (DUF1049 family)